MRTRDPDLSREVGRVTVEPGAGDLVEVAQAGGTGGGVQRACARRSLVPGPGAGGPEILLGWVGLGRICCRLSNSAP